MSKIQPFSAQVRQIGDSAVIDLHGEVDSFADAGMQAANTQVESLNPAQVVLNFTDVSYINSTGIALIVSLLARSRKVHRKVVVYGLSDHYVTIFQITRLSDYMTIYMDEAAALASLSESGV